MSLSYTRIEEEQGHVAEMHQDEPSTDEQLGRDGRPAGCCTNPWKARLWASRLFAPAKYRQGQQSESP